jgi:hypothetical protein
LAVIFGQGESDSVALLPPETYKAALLQLATDYDTDLRAATGQSKKIPLICYQMNSTGRAIGLAQYEATTESSIVRMACPMYQFGYYDSLHINSVSSRVLGAYYGEAVKTVAIDGDHWEPLAPTDAQVVGNTIAITFNKRGLIFDTTLMPAQVNHGFSVKDASGASVAVNSVDLKNGNQVRITCASTPGALWLVQYGNLACVGKTPYVGGAGNLRDSAGVGKVFDGVPLHNWCVLFDYVL